MLLTVVIFSKEAAATNIAAAQALTQRGNIKMEISRCASQHAVGADAAVFVR